MLSVDRPQRKITVKKASSVDRGTLISRSGLLKDIEWKLTFYHALKYKKIFIINEKDHTNVY